MQETQIPLRLRAEMDGSYSFAWTVTETADDGANGSCAILSEGTKPTPTYNTDIQSDKGRRVGGNPPTPRGTHLPRSLKQRIV